MDQQEEIELAFARNLAASYADEFVRVVLVTPIDLIWRRVFFATSAGKVFFCRCKMSELERPGYFKTRVLNELGMLVRHTTELGSPIRISQAWRSEIVNAVSLARFVAGSPVDTVPDDADLAFLE